ncbi:MAG: hypothetical protein M0Q44_19725 [Methylobacter sp.]|jgi:hypothetical protein|nr:hypothetical protein [Methylobacter sp.]
MNINDKFLFKPRQEAHPMNWRDLLPPVRQAVADLLIRIDGAEQINDRKDDKDNKEVANCFLVYGIRGTGKTTVLQSAQEAICLRKDFFPEDKLEETAGKKNAEQSAENLNKKHIVWLPILDLEPLSAKSNLLTIVLTHVSNALEQPGCGKKGATLTSIFEESADSARQQFSQLIHDATFIWEDIQEADTRGKANRQVAAADIYADFHENFKKAMAALSKQLGQVHGSDYQGCSIVLPIDNIDRSTDHLQSIVKLAQLVSHSRLWLVMAGDRVDVETFLERAYWKELINSKDGVGAQGKNNWDGEDEALVMARRQAASSYQKLLPPSHRIEVKCVEPKETLRFKFSANEKDTTYDLLKQINVFLNEEQGDGRKIPFTDLLDVRNFIETSEATKVGQKGMFLAHKIDDNYSIEEGINVAGQKSLLLAHEVDIEYLAYPSAKSINPQDEFKYLTHLAQHGLQLPARAVLDLWQLANCVVKDTSNENNKKNFQAEKIARTMLRNAIFRSDMSSRAEQILQDDIIQRSSDSGTILNFKYVNLIVDHLAITDKLPKVLNDRSLSRSTLNVRRLVDINLRLATKNCNKNLPEDVAAWLSILYDILVLVERPAVIVGSKIKPPIVNVSHEVIMVNQRMRNGKSKKKDDQKKIDDPKSFWWPTPIWRTFLAHDLFWKQWKIFIKDDFPEVELSVEDDVLIVILTRLLVAGWVACSLKTFSALNCPAVFDSSRESKNAHENSDGLKKKEIQIQIQIQKAVAIDSAPTKSLLEKNKIDDNLKKYREQLDKYREQLDKYEESVIKAAHALFDQLYQLRLLKMRGIIEKEPMIDWLETKMPLLFCYLYVPLDENLISADLRCKNMYDNRHGESALAKYWQKNAPFLLNDVDKDLKLLFPVDEMSLKKKEPDEEYDEYINLIGPFGALHKFWGLVSADIKGPSNV